MKLYENYMKLYEIGMKLYGKNNEIVWKMYKNEMEINEII